MANNAYVHGYSEREASRLSDQANTLSDLLHHDTVYAPGSQVLEAGCGVGSQTRFLVENSPEAHFTSVDISAESLEKARERLARQGATNVTFQQGDIFNLDFADEQFDYVFVCFLLEHLPNPVEALACLSRVLKKGGTITAIEGDHGSFYCHPESAEARQTVDCLIRSQAELGGNSLIGRELYPLLCKAGYRDVHVSPRMVYVDSSKPDWVEGFSKLTFIAMVEGVREQALAAGMMSEEAWDKGIGDLYAATAEDGTFCYTFFKGVGVK